MGRLITLDQAEPIIEGCKAEAHAVGQPMNIAVVDDGGTLEVPTMQIILTEINFIGNLVGSFNELVELMDLAAQGKVRLHTSSYPLADINTAIEDLDGGRLRGRGILVP
jgi:NAD+-dependent secondary alcohol dehydrogenase Adh1